VTRRPPPLVIGIGAAVASVVSSPAPAADVDEVVARASAFVEGVGDDLAAVVADEHYRQVWTAEGAAPMWRRLTSEFVLVRVADRPEWVGFRDVVAVDDRPVPERGDRLQTLFLDPGRGALARARVIADESARYNLGRIDRNFNVPTAAFFFLHPANRDRFRFGLDRIEPEDGKVRWVVAYHERSRPTLVRTPRGRDVPASGRLWIDPASGRVGRTQLWLTTPADREDDLTVDANIATTFAFEPAVEGWVPVEMRERFKTSQGDLLDATATYDNYRRFRVDARLLPPGDRDR